MGDRSRKERLIAWAKLIISVVALILVFMLVQPILATYLYFFVYDLGLTDDLWFTLEYEVVGAACGFLLVLVLGGGRMLRPSGREIVGALRACSYMIAVDTAFGILSISAEVASGSVLVEGWFGRMLLMIAICLFVGLSEESLFRALPTSGLLGVFGRTRRGIVGCCVATSIGFGLAHVLPLSEEISLVVILQAVLKTVQTGMCGLLWASILVRDRSVWGVGIAHGLTDLPDMLSTALFTSGALETNYVSSGEEGWVTVVTYLIIISIYAPLVFRAVKILRELPYPDYGGFSRRPRPLPGYQANPYAPYGGPYAGPASPGGVYPNQWQTGYQQPMYQQPATPQQPTYQQPTYQQPTYQQPATPQQPTYQQPTYPSQPTYQQPAYPSQPTYQQPAYPSQPTYQQPAYPQQPGYPMQPGYSQPTYPQQAGQDDGRPPAPDGWDRPR